MEYQSAFQVRYETEAAVPITDIIASLQGVELAIREMAELLPAFMPGVQVARVEIKVREIAQASPLREAFLVALMVAYQKELSEEVPNLIASATGHHVPESIDGLVTFLTLTILFYGVGAVKVLLMGEPDGPAKAQLDKLVAELAHRTGLSEEQIKDRLEDRYSEKKRWTTLKRAIMGVFRPSKRQNSAPIEVNDVALSRDVVRDIPADFEVEKVDEVAPFRSLEDAQLEIHAQDRDHGGKGWAAIIPGAVDRRVPLKLMTGVRAEEVWGNDHIRGDVTIIYDRVADGMVPKAIHLHRVDLGKRATGDAGISPYR